MFVQCLLFLSIFGSLNADYYRMSLRPQPCIIPRLDHGRVRVRRSTLIKFICLQRYELVGNRYATCKDGRWDAPTPVCVRSGCTVPNIENGIVAASRNNAWVMYFCLPDFKLVGSPAIYCDGRRWNASAPTCVNSKIQNSLSCDFESSLCGWTQDELHDFDWKRLNNKTPSSFLNTGPSHDHTLGPEGSGYYMYIESTSRLENDTARFISPVYERALSENGCFSFFYHMYGSGCGGLRVYQKPDNLPLEVLVQSSDEMKKEYILFEKWGNLGDFWYNSVARLRQFDDNFQIIIEGIRGFTFTSDIAIDDVAILQGENCTAAIVAASTPSPNPYIPDSCVGRCRTLDTADTTPGCGCSSACLVHGNCCPDFFDVCVFVTDSTSADDMLPANSSDDDAAPFTQKLVATTPETTSTSTTTTTTSTTTTTTPRPTTTTTTTTTQRPTTTTTTTTTTQRPTTTSTTTTQQPTTTTQSTSKTTPSTIPTSTIKVTIAPTIKTTLMEVPTTIKKVTTFTTKPTTDMPYGISRTIENHNNYHELIEKRRKENTVETRKLEYTHGIDAEQKSSNGWKVALSVLGVLFCVVVVLALKLGRSARGRVALARLRSRATNDPEVRYLSADNTDY
ncbi:MAM and LDL-receptor class A domain-containing protein 1-like [Maniola jurtina]|uniref:MAM and LDL-receptor class A domain-containing protein 1-like n=1 Tax=Maniola jurtina TaxID=191418 RepID=UPI001E68BA1E|nr:MAM and LDL-receptor class A domain-containing protein 1-like [Maniola jurtina]